MIVQVFVRPPLHQFAAAINIAFNSLKMPHDSTLFRPERLAL